MTSCIFFSISLEAISNWANVASNSSFHVDLVPEDCAAFPVETDCTVSGVLSELRDLGSAVGGRLSCAWNCGGVTMVKDVAMSRFDLLKSKTKISQ